jgi:predicted nucleotidyltransferase
MTPPSPESLYQQLFKACKFLQDQHIPFMVIGGIAVSIWTTPRATVDLDFVIGLHEDAISFFIESAAQVGFVVFDSKPMEFKKMKLLRMFMTGADAQLLTMDFILADDEYKHEALSRAVSFQLEGQEIKVASPEDVILLKLMSGRDQDKVDAQNIFRARKDSLDKNYLQQWAKRLSVTQALNSLLNH